MDMVNTIKAKYGVSEQNYKNIYNEYKRRITDAKSGKITGSITNYAGAYSDDKMTQEQRNDFAEKARVEGHSEDEINAYLQGK